MALCATALSAAFLYVRTGSVDSCPGSAGISRAGFETCAQSEGTGTLGDTAAGTISALLSHPLVAGLLGAALGTGMLLLSHVTARTVTPDDAQLGMMRVGIMMVLRMVLALASLFAYYTWLRSGLVPFGIGLVVGFLVMIAVELFRLGTRSAPSVR